MAEDVVQGRNHCREKIDVLVDGNVISTDFSAPANTVDRLAWPGKHITTKPKKSKVSHKKSKTWYVEMYTRIA
jgi:hypothetical protein